MRDGFIKAAVCTPELRVADCIYNAEQMVRHATRLSEEEKVKILVFPEFSLTGYTCQDLFLQDTLLSGAEMALNEYRKRTETLEMVSVLGLPLLHRGRLYNTAVVVSRGKVLGIVPKTHLPNYGEFYEARQFSPGQTHMGMHTFSWGEEVQMGTALLFQECHMEEFCFAVEICEDLWMPAPPSAAHAMAGACMIVNLSASDELTGKAKYRRELVKNQSARTLSVYLYADAGEGESTQDMVFAGHDLIVENGVILKENLPFEGRKELICEVDLGRMAAERRRMSSFTLAADPERENGYQVVLFDLGEKEETHLTRSIERLPFVPADIRDREDRCNEILNIQATGLAKRLKHTGCKNVVIGLSGGLDSTLALLVAVRAFERLSLPMEGICCVTMPCFGTTERTRSNAFALAEALKTEIREIPIKESVLQHFADIGHDPDIHDVTYENAQARERTQVLMDLANRCNGMVIGTGDMSELALGWATYNGDHMSMYGVNASVPKTLVRYLVKYYAEYSENKALREVLEDILDTPVSPELLPPEDGKISQKTEDLVGPYELHDFFLYYVLRFGFGPQKIFRLAVQAFSGEYTKETICRWMEIFFHRFFRQHFKRSCLPDGPKVGSVSVSPRGDLRMPSDACDTLWKKELSHIRESLV